VRLAGQVTGVEGYLESAATGLAIGLYLAKEATGAPLTPLPATTGLGALARHLTESDPASFQPANVNWGLFLPLAGRVSREERKSAYAARASEELAAWAALAGLPLEETAPGELPAAELTGVAVGPPP
jgi:methylenetetrahydrofolate--tRNA-(uracil-5-)-methyltransferase